MDAYEYLRKRIAYVRNGYTATPRERKRLYLWLKLNEPLWQGNSIRKKLGGYNYAWLVGLVKYGDEHDWYRQELMNSIREERRHGK